MEQKTPVMLVTGGLGSGKTTLVRRILDKATLRLAVLMNEFGEIAIDSQVIRGRNIDIVELAGGCVCCSMTGEFEAAVREIVDAFHPEFLVVEATGVAESDALAYEIEDNLPEVRLDSVVYVADAYLSARHPRVGYSQRVQIASADIVLINKIDLLATDEVKEVEEQVRKYNNRAVFFKTVGCDVDAESLFGVVSRAERPRALTLHGEAEFQSFAWSSGKMLDRQRFESLLDRLPEQVFRAKGFVRFSEGSLLFNYVAGRADFEDFESDSTRLVFIGRTLDDVRPRVVELLRSCEME